MIVLIYDFIASNKRWWKLIIMSKMKWHMDENLNHPTIKKKRGISTSLCASLSSSPFTVNNIGFSVVVFHDSSSDYHNNCYLVVQLNLFFWWGKKTKERTLQIKTFRRSSILTQTNKLDSNDTWFSNY